MPTPEDDVTTQRAPHPLPGPSLTEVVDGHTGRVRVSGHLTPQGADLLRGTVEGLRRLGHSTVVLDLADVQAADAVGLHVLSDLRTTMRASGDELLVRNAPRETAVG